MTVKTLETYFVKTLDDLKLTSSERKALKQVLREASLTKTKRDLLRSKIYSLAETRLGQGRDRDVMAWLKSSNQLILDAAETEPMEADVHFSPGPHCREAITSEVGMASRSIDICVFTISDDRITETILWQHHRGIPVRIISDNDKANDRGSDIEKMAREGVPVRIDRTEHHMHHKFALFDKDKVLTGSYNWTRSAEKSNEENILLTNSPEVVKAYQKEFDKLWKKMQPY